MKMRDRNQYVMLYLVSFLFFISHAYSSTSSGQRRLQISSEISHLAVMSNLNPSGSSSQPTICKLISLEVLDLSNNQLSGPIPECLGNFSKALSTLNMRMNNFQGNLPLSFTRDNNLRSLDFSHNHLQGQIPQSLVNCTKLEVLNLGNNNMSGEFPLWLNSLQELKILVLRENRFHGSLLHPLMKYNFSKLHIIDLSFNQFTGKLPSEYFKTWNAMLTEEKSTLKYMGDDGNYYTDSVTVMNKGTEMILVKILTFFTAIDLSNNKFHGDIPDSMGTLKALIVLNLSGNSFTGHIPSSFMNLVELQSLDLSKNNLSGRIPPELNRLTFLEYLNMSQNQLVGPIPQGAQFSTFETSSFVGNSELCGVPLSKKCEKDEAPTSEQSHEAHEPSFEDGFNWKVVVMGYACGLLVGIIIGHVFTKRRPRWIARTFRVNLRK